MTGGAASSPATANDGGKASAKKDAGAPPATVDAGDASAAGDDDDDAEDASSADAAPVLPLPPTQGDLLALTQHCNVASNGKYSPHPGLPQSVDICRLNGAFFFRTELLIDCDGQAEPECATARGRGSQTAVPQSDGKPLDPVHVPFIVLPEPSATFNYVTADIHDGAVVVVLYAGKMAYGIFGDTGPANMIGEGSYGMAQALGINPDPVNGGVPDGVTYIVFTGAQAVANPTQDHAAAQALGQTLAAQLVANN